MASTEKVSNQVKSIGDHFDISNHTFLNQIIGGLQNRMSRISPDLVINPAGKTSSLGKIKLTLTGQVVLENREDIDDTSDKTRQLMDSLKNPSNLLSLLDG